MMTRSVSRLTRVCKGWNVSTKILTNFLCAAVILVPRPTWAQVDPIVATIGDVIIRQSEVNKRWEQDDPGSFLQEHARTYMSEKRALDSIISDYLLAVEAKRSGITVDDLLKREVRDKLPAAPADQVRPFLAKTPPPPDISREKATCAVSQFLQRDAFAAAEGAYLRQLGASVKVNFKPFRRLVNVTAADRVIGGAAAKVQIIEFADFECPFCKEVESALKIIR